TSESIGDAVRVAEIAVGPKRMRQRTNLGPSGLRRLPLCTGAGRRPYWGGYSPLQGVQSTPKRVPSSPAPMFRYPLVDRHGAGVTHKRQTEASRSARSSPLGDLLHRPRRDDLLGWDAQALGALAPERLEVELARRVRVGVDGERA